MHDHDVFRSARIVQQEIYMSYKFVPYYGLVTINISSFMNQSMKSKKKNIKGSQNRIKQSSL